jgi:hypothetical protein
LVDLTWWDLAVFGVSVVIGAGIFSVTASTFGNIHANLATAFSLNGIHRLPRSFRSARWPASHC